MEWSSAHSYTRENLYLYANFDYCVAQGTQVESGPFNFAPNELAYIKTHYIFLDHDQTYSASAGAVYRLAGLHFSASTESTAVVSAPASPTPAICRTTSNSTLRKRACKCLTWVK